MHLLTATYIVVVLGTGVSAICSGGCLAGACDSDGVCTSGCKPNYVGAACDSCSQTGAFWNAKFQQCHSCPQVCLTCVSLTNCTECVTDGLYGDSCESSCGYGCKNEKCEKNTGACACNTGYAPDKCDTCAEGYYQDGYDCLECTGDCLTCRLAGNDVVCESCSTGVYGESCDIPCPGGCAASKCFMNGTCSDGCNGGFMGASCDQCVAGKWGAGCDQNCPTTCTTCISDTDCTACTVGYYGDTCSTLCSAGCEGGCDKASGACTACKDGYSGDLCCLQSNNCETCSSNTDCSECKGGFYGATCEGVCPQNCRRCSSTDDCVSSCVDGFYGVVCDQDCPENCKVCESASACSTCESGYFGATCQEECAENCVENTCQKISGNCLACEEGFTGDKCDEVSAGNPVAEIGVWMLMLPLVIASLMT